MRIAKVRLHPCHDRYSAAPKTMRPRHSFPCSLSRLSLHMRQAASYTPHRRRSVPLASARYWVTSSLATHSLSSPPFSLPRIGRSLALYVYRYHPQLDRTDSPAGRALFPLLHLPPARAHRLLATVNIVARSLKICFAHIYLFTIPSRHPPFWSYLVLFFLWSTRCPMTNIATNHHHLLQPVSLGLAPLPALRWPARPGARDLGAAAVHIAHMALRAPFPGRRLRPSARLRSRLRSAKERGAVRGLGCAGDPSPRSFL
ncbi:hypothetical protein BD413DRAFT_79280 [Trametes elegans]|nr:hypothetical protein BD413DRAFT_79280 [Trametes elegans]